MRRPPRHSAELVLIAVVLFAGAMPATALADDVSVERAYKSGERSLERPARKVERSLRGELTRAKARKGIVALRGLRKAVGKVKRSVAHQKSSSATGARARKAALGSHDAGIAATRYLERSLRYLIRAITRDSARDARTAVRLAERGERAAGKADRLDVQAGKLFAQAKKEREALPPAPAPPAPASGY